MFLIFQLHRADVFSIGDLGIQRGMARLVGKDAAKNPAVKSNKWKYMAEKDMREMSETFKPYRTLFSLLMYKVSDQAVEKEKEKAKGKAKGKRKAKAKVEEKEEKEEGS